MAPLSAIALVDPALAAWLTVEHGVVEWVQVLLDGGAALLFGRELVRTTRETGRVSPLDLTIVSCLIGLIIGEVDLDRHLRRRAVSRLLVRGWAAVAQPWGRVLAASVALSMFTELFEKQRCCSRRLTPGRLTKMTTPVTSLPFENARRRSK